VHAPDPGRPAVRGWAVVAVATVVFTVAGVAITYTPVFGARRIDVRTGGGLGRERVLAIAGVDVGSNVFHLDVLATERALERDPRVLDARVATDLPDRIEIRIVPRRAVAVLAEPDLLVGADGVAIGPAGGDRGDLPVLRGEDGRSMDGPRLRRAAAAAGAMSEALRRLVDAVVVLVDGRLEIRIVDGPTVSFGDATELEEKAASLVAMLRWAEEEGVRIVRADVAVPSSPSAQLERGGGPVEAPAP
jgi:cell division protein FtsQ